VYISAREALLDGLGDEEMDRDSEDAKEKHADSLSAYIPNGDKFPAVSALRRIIRWS
jgi:hypothetical protein